MPIKYVTIVKFVCEDGAEYEEAYLGKKKHVPGYRRPDDVLCKPVGYRYEDAVAYLTKLALKKKKEVNTNA